MSNAITTLSNGLKIANFSSPHPFIFVDGSVLPAVDNETARALMLDAVEVEHPQFTIVDDGLGYEVDRIRWIDIELVFKLNETVRQAVEDAQASNADIVLVPLPVLMAVKAAGLPVGKLRVCRVADRITKTICIDRFCI